MRQFNKLFINPRRQTPPLRGEDGRGPEISNIMTKKIFTFILALLAIATTAGAQGGVVINTKNFPFTNFRKFVKDNYDKDHDNYLNQGEIAAVTKINVFNRSIGDLKGIEFFMELEELDCRQNQLTSLDVSQNTKLTELCCYNNQIKGDKMQALVNSLPTVEGEEKGKFEFGGSTIVMLFGKDTICPDEDILRNSAEGIETVVKYGEKIGKACR